MASKLGQGLNGELPHLPDHIKGIDERWKSRMLPRGQHHPRRHEPGQRITDIGQNQSMLRRADHLGMVAAGDHPPRSLTFP
jgi:hypothetical protein